MRSTPSATGRHRDGSPRRSRHLRPLRVAPTSLSGPPRTGHSARCRRCGHRIDLYQSTGPRSVALHPAELPITHVPESWRWHLSGGLAHPHADDSNWCRILHTLLCPARTPTCPLTPFLETTRRELAVRTRLLIDAGAITPTPRPAGPCSLRDPALADRPVVQILLVRYLAPSSLDAISCVAHTRHPCARTVLTPERPAGRWRLLPTSPRRDQLALPEKLMAVYDLSHLPHTEQQRWRAQRCPTHAAADLALLAWQVFDPLLHAAHICTRLPRPAALHRRER
ncbi:DUF6083 domain-containing protein [Streptomyces sp. CA-249302]|uniref:DUF6083 domain-containing protein n=1 Tax=Streptomyces sp. CA-249302 TaxID=3240058 RepID=UPI003D8A5CC6